MVILDVTVVFCFLGKSVMGTGPIGVFLGAQGVLVMGVAGWLFDGRGRGWVTGLHVGLL